jgi:hypothetical protein
MSSSTQGVYFPEAMVAARRHRARRLVNGLSVGLCRSPSLTALLHEQELARVGGDRGGARSGYLNVAHAPLRRGEHKQHGGGGLAAERGSLDVARSRGEEQLQLLDSRWETCCRNNALNPGNRSRGVQGPPPSSLWGFPRRRRRARNGCER